EPFRPLLAADTDAVVGEQWRCEQQQPAVVSRGLHWPEGIGKEPVGAANLDDLIEDRETAGQEPGSAHELTDSWNREHDAQAGEPTEGRARERPPCHESERRGSARRRIEVKPG